MTTGLQRIQAPTVSLTDSQRSMPSLRSADAESVTRGRKLAARILSNYPDYGKAPPEYLLTLSETLAGLTTSEIVWLCDANDGLATVCKYLPTTADIHDFLKAKRAKAEQFKPAHTAYRKLNEDHGPWEAETDFERKKRVVQELLGYDPMKVTKAPLRDLVGKDIPKDASQLKTPAAPPSKYLLAIIEEQRQLNEERLNNLFREDAA